ncbi:MAG: 3-dehydroquinate synthase [Lewinellaceae bacterium]|nr:3-dehydroquinate synthase [Phaeodactylibacter sp.]MCB0614026.1 3-dehydroquinate synthase [Phaeodactylibacter sp.]MCB9346121.1 3-dehydroquinate synthase [Lewinellaceae bacterium]
MEAIQLKDYTIYVGPLQQSLPGFLKGLSYGALFVIADNNTQAFCLPLLEKALGHSGYHLIQIPAGEAHKTLDTCQQIWAQLMAQRAGRDALVLNLGGGVIGDMGGFCAATFKRGIRFIQLPTTLLSQVDASIGGKLGIDFMQVKNSIGLFRDPLGVFIDPAFLATLPGRELRSGYAEIIKHSLIADAGLWRQLQELRRLDEAGWEALISPSLHIKKRIVEADPFEKGLRKALNFGHTIGHAIEGFALDTQTPLLHGEAIAIGMICETYLSAKEVGLPEKDVEQVARYIIQHYGHQALNPRHYEAYLRLMGNDKKNEGQDINFSLINPIGQAAINRHCSADLIVESLEFYNTLAKA